MTREKCIDWLCRLRSFLTQCGMPKEWRTNFHQALSDVIKSIEQESKTEKVIKMRDVTPEEREIINKYIKSISEPTGINLWDLYKNPCDDAISRQDVLDLCDSKDQDYKVIHFKEDVECLPPVTPQPKTAHWITTRTFMHDGEFYCDRCKCDSPRNEKWDYCPNCGAKMVESQKKQCENCNHYGKLSLNCGRCDDDCSMFEPRESEIRNDR